MRKTLVTEMLLSFLLGSVPMLLVSGQPDFSAAKSLASLDPGDIVVYYFFYLLCIHTFVWFVNGQILKTNHTISVFFQQLHEFTHKLGFAIHGIYRALAGAVPMAIWFELNRLGLVQGWQAVTVLSITLAISSLTASVALARATEYMAPRMSIFRK